MYCGPSQYFLGVVYRDIFREPLFENGFVLRHAVNAMCWQYNHMQIGHGT